MILAVDAVDGSWREKQSCREACEGFESDRRAGACSCRISSLRSVSTKDLILPEKPPHSSQNLPLRFFQTSCRTVGMRRTLRTSDAAAAVSMVLERWRRHYRANVPPPHPGAPLRLGSKLWRHLAQFGDFGKSSRPACFLMNHMVCLWKYLL